MGAVQNTAEEKKVTPQGLMHLGVIYIVWSSTYLAIRVAVRDGSGFPVFTLGLMRVAFAAAILLIWAKLKKQRIVPTWQELVVLMGSGVFLWVGGNGLVMVAEQRADSGLTALLIAAMPIWSTLIEAILDRKTPSYQTILALLIGFSGVGILAAPTLFGGVQADFLTMIALILAPISWSVGSIWQARRPVAVSPQVNSAYQMLAGGIGFTALVFIMQEPRPTPTPEAWLAWAYLVIFGAVLAYTSYVTVLRIMPIKLVMTYAYVNPVLAVILGWLILDESITIWTIGGSVLVLLGVVLVFRERNNNKR